jgi:multidrug resistance efflux pump
MTLQSRFSVVSEAIDEVLRRLQALPQSDRREQLHAWVLECLEQAERWSEASRTDREREGLMKRVLALHVAVAKLERDALFAPGNGVVGNRDERQ